MDRPLDRVSPPGPAGRTHVTVRRDGGAHTVRAGTPLGELLPAEVDGELTVAGLIDHRPYSLVTRVWSDAELAPITTGHWEGARIHRRSVGLLLLEAAARARPGVRLSIEHSHGYAVAVAVAGATEPLDLLVAALTGEMIALVDRDLPLLEQWWSVEDAREHLRAAGWHDAAALLETRRHAAVAMSSYGRVFAPRFGALAPRTGMLGEFCLLPDLDGFLLVHGVIDPASDRGDAPAPLAPAGQAAACAAARAGAPALRDHLHWLDTLGARSVAALNRACIGGRVSQLIRVAEGYQEKRIGQIADAIAARRGEIGVVCIAGPSSSGKTTFIERLRVQLQVDGVVPKGLSLDDYYADRDAMPRGSDGDYDFEALASLRLDLLRDHVRALLDGEHVHTARYDFHTGQSAPAGGPEIHLGGTEVLLVEGIHGLNPALLGAVDERRIFRIFVNPLAQLPFDALTRLHASDLRLLRRIVRDRHGRSTDAAATIARWPSVRDGERRHIFPHQGRAHAVFDSSLIYEPAVLRVYAERYLLEVPPAHASYATAFRLLELLDQFVTIYPDHVPPNSILREFIGGGGFEA
ncbi:MAG: nucleoside kinase [Deltaproteobacteria bacterium]|nr:nucleoside kinase [Deltaproteobacteria bacterium]